MLSSKLLLFHNRPIASDGVWTAIASNGTPSSTLLMCTFAIFVSKILVTDFLAAGPEDGSCVKVAATIYILQYGKGAPWTLNSVGSAVAGQLVTSILECPVL
jgi:hypothetical protein